MCRSVCARRIEQFGGTLMWGSVRVVAMALALHVCFAISQSCSSRIRVPPPNHPSMWLTRSQARNVFRAFWVQVAVAVAAVFFVCVVAHSLTHSQHTESVLLAWRSCTYSLPSENRFEFEFERYTLWVCSALLLACEKRDIDSFGIVVSK